MVLVGKMIHTNVKIGSIKWVSALGLIFLALVILFTMSLALPRSVVSAQEPGNKTNVIYMLVDDLGIGDIEPYGQTKIRTPNLNRMAGEGMLFTQHYAGNTVCAPSRASLLTGKHSGHAQIRGNFELGGYTDATEFGQMPLNPGTPTIATMMQQAGYHTSLIGKWGLGGPGSHGEPNKHGFDYFFGYLDQKQAHNHYPTHLWENDTVFPLDNRFVHPHQRLPEGADAHDPESYAAYQREDFAQERLTLKALEIIENQRNNPFFIYFALATPHAAMQAPENEIEAYSHFEETPYQGGYLPQRRPRATRAAMITNIDSALGRIMNKLEELGLAENTLIVFSSDNGPAPEGGSDVEFFDSNASYRGVKRDLYEGGIRMPTLAWWPGSVRAGAISNHVSAFWDVMPTLAELAGVESPDSDGLSFLPTLLGQNQKRHENLYWEFHNVNGAHAQAVRFWDAAGISWKGVKVYNRNSAGEPPLELYNLDQDAVEEHDVSASNPALVIQAENLLRTSRQRSFIDAWNFDYSPQLN